MSATVRFNPDRQRWTVYVSRDGKRKSITCADEARTRDPQLGKVIPPMRIFVVIIAESLCILAGGLASVFAVRLASIAISRLELIFR